MTHDVDDLRASLTARAEQSDFTVSFDQVRRRARRQRRRSVVVTAIAALVLLALVVPFAVLRSDAPTPTLDLSKDDLPRPEKGWRIVDDPISTGARDVTEGRESVLWFTMRSDGAVRLNEGILDAATGQVRRRNPDQVGELGQPSLSRYAQKGNRSGGYRMPGTAPGVGLYYGEDVERIAFVSQRGMYREGEQTVIEARLARLSVDPNVIAFWAAPVESSTLAPEDRHDDFTLRAYDADGSVIEPDPYLPDPESRFVPADAPRIGELVRTGVETGSGEEAVAALHGRDGWVGLVVGRRDRGSGRITDLRSVGEPAKLDGFPLVESTTIALPDGRVLALGVTQGCGKYLVRLPTGGTVPVGSTAPWSEDKAVVIWWVVLEKRDLRGDSRRLTAECE